MAISDPGPRPRPSRPELSVVVLCYRAGEQARPVAAAIAAALVENGITDYQLVLVGNYIEGVRDVTPEVVRDLAAHDPRIVCSAAAKRGRSEEHTSELQSPVHLV